MQKPASSPARLEGSRQGLARRGARGSRLGALGTQLREGQVPQELGGLCGTAGDIVRGGYVGPLLLLQRMATSSAAGNGTGLSSRVLVVGRLGGAGRKVPAQLAPRGPWGGPPWLPPASSGRPRSLAHTMPRGSHLRVTCALTDTPASLSLPVWSLWTGRITSPARGP